MTSTPALDQSVKTLADLAKDVSAALQPGQTLAQKLAQFSNLLGDAMAEAAVLGNLSAEIKALQPDDYGRLAGILVSDLGFASPHAAKIAAAAVKLLSDGLIGDVLGLVQAVQTP